MGIEDARQWALRPPILPTSTWARRDGLHTLSLGFLWDHVDSRASAACRGYARQRKLGYTQVGRPGWAAEVTDVVGSLNVRRYL